MNYTVSITPTALLDIAAAIEYYNLKANDLGFKFADDVENNINEIVLLPKGYSIKYKDVRGKVLKKFPFIILYTIKEELSNIELIRIFNTYQNQYWDE